MKPIRPPVSRDPHVPRGSAGAIVGLLQTEMPSELRAHFGQRQVLVDARCFDLAERHDLDECNPHVTRVRPTDHRFKLIFVDALERNDIDFHREPRPLRGVNPGRARDRDRHAG